MYCNNKYIFISVVSLVVLSILALFVCCENDNTVGYWKPSGNKEFDEIVLSLDKAVVKNEHDSVCMKQFQRLQKISASDANLVVNARMTYWNAYFNILDSNNEGIIAKLSIARSSLPKEYEYDKARLAYLQSIEEHKIGNYSNAYFLLVNEAIPVFGKFDEYHLAESYQMLSYIFSSLGEYTQALEYFNLALKILKTNGVHIEDVNKDMMYALICKNHNESIDILMSILRNDSINTYTRSLAGINLLGMYIISDNYKEGVNVVDYCYKNILINHEDEHWLNASFYANAATCYFMDKEYHRSLEHAEQSEILCKRYRYTELLTDIYLLKARILHALELKTESYKYMTLYIEEIASEEQTPQKQEFLLMEERDKVNRSEKAINELIQQKKTAKYISIIIILTVFVIAITLCWVILSLKARNKAQQMRNNILSNSLTEEIKKTDYQKTQIEASERKIAAAGLQIAEKDKILNEIKKIIDNDYPIKEKVLRLNLYVAEILESSSFEKSWAEAKTHFETMHPNFFVHLKSNCPDMTENEMRLCMYIYMGMRAKEIANLLKVTPGAINISRYRIRKKLNLQSEDSLEDYLRKIFKTSME